MKEQSIKEEIIQKLGFFKSELATAILVKDLRSQLYNQGKVLDDITKYLKNSLTTLDPESLIVNAIVARLNSIKKQFIENVTFIKNEEKRIADYLGRIKNVESDAFHQISILQDYVTGDKIKLKD